MKPLTRRVMFVSFRFVCRFTGTNKNVGFGAGGVKCAILDTVDPHASAVRNRPAVPFAIGREIAEAIDVTGLVLLLYEGVRRAGRENESSGQDEALDTTGHD